MKKIILTAVVVLMATISYAQDKNKKMTFDVNGKCGMCKERIEKAALGVKGVKFATS
ncbi:MAG: hypothetical protein ACN4ES_09435 [Cellulophaga baltica]